MLKLTQWNDHESPIYISAKAIRVLMRDAGDKTIVDVGRTYWVIETPEQIMAMPEMCHAIYGGALVDASRQQTAMELLRQATDERHQTKST